MVVVQIIWAKSSGAKPGTHHELHIFKMQLMAMHTHINSCSCCVESSLFLIAPSEFKYSLQKTVYNNVAFIRGLENPEGLQLNAEQLLEKNLLLSSFSICSHFSDASNSCYVTFGLLPKRYHWSFECSFSVYVLLRFNFHLKKKKKKQCLVRGSITCYCARYCLHLPGMLLPLRYGNI